MEKVKVELLLICREHDTGDPGSFKNLIDGFFDNLLKWMTPAGIESLGVDYLRTLYVCFMVEMISNGPVAADTTLPLYIHVMPAKRRAPEAPPLALNVESIFRK